MFNRSHLAVLALFLFAGSNASAAFSAQNTKMGNPRPPATKQASPKDNEKFYFICSSENSKQCRGEKIDHMVLSIAEQRLYAFHDGEIVAWSNVSTGKAGKDTPLGTFRVSQKHIDHFSNKYNNAPMPYFMRLTDDGVGFHAGILPGYAASHGCIRLPFEMAKHLYEHTPSGTPVTVIAGRVDPLFASAKHSPSFTRNLERHPSPDMSNSSTETPLITRLAHLCLKTDKLQEMVSFYRDVIGLPIKFDLKNNVGTPFGYYFDLGNRTFLEIFDNQLAARQWDYPPDPLERPKAMHYGHFCMESPDLAKLKALWLTRGLKAGEIKTGMDGSLQMWITDPDGNAIEVMQYTPASLQTK